VRFRIKNRNLRISFIAYFLFFASLFFLRADISGQNSVQSNKSEKYEQWFTGPVLTPTPITMPPGHPALEVAYLVLDTYGEYKPTGTVKNVPDIWSTGPYVDFQAGFNKIIGIEFIGSITANFSQGAHSIHPRDSILRLGFQVSNDKENSWIPDFRILLQETVPTGRYRNLSLSNHATDSTGQGSFDTGVHFAVQKLFHPQKNHPLRIRGDVGYFVPAPVHIKGLSSYSETVRASGTVHPGKHFTSFLFGEYALSRTWAIACEVNYQQGERGKFSRKKGAKIRVPSFTQFTVLPEIQHTFKADVGMIIGGWFTATGKNASAFRGAFVSFLFAF